MKHHHVSRALLLSLAVVGFGQRVSAQAPDVSALLAHEPAADPAATEKLARELIQAGPAGITQIIKLLVEPGKGDDSAARFALHTLAHHTARVGHETERQMFVQAVLTQLAAEHPVAVKSFLIQQLQLCGGPEVVPTLAGFLLNAELCEFATQALIAIKTESAVAALRTALPKAEGKNRVTLLQALGVLRDAQAAPLLLQAAKDGDETVRLEALFGLANIGDASSSALLLKAADTENGAAKFKATDDCLLLAKRLVEATRNKEAEQIYRALWTKRTAPTDRQVRCAVVQGLAVAAGVKALPDVIAAFSAGDPQLRAVAIEAGVAMAGKEATTAWVERLKDATPADRATILSIIGRRGDHAALPAIVAALKDADNSVRLAAIDAAANLGGEEMVKSLVALLDSDQEAERAAAQKSLRHLPGKEVSPALAVALGAASPQQKRALLTILAARGSVVQMPSILAAANDKDDSVRIAALSALAALAGEKELPALVKLVIKASTDAERAEAERALINASRRTANERQRIEPVLAAVAGVDAPARCALLRVLGRSGGSAALVPVQAALKDANEQVRDTAARVLAEWPDPTALSDLFELAKSSPNPTQRVMAFRGIVRLIGAEKLSPDAKLKLCSEALAIAAEPDQKKSVLGALASVHTPAALAKVSPLLDDQAVREEAAAASVAIAQKIPGTVEVKAAMTKVLEVAKNEQTRKLATEVLGKIK